LIRRRDCFNDSALQVEPHNGARFGSRSPMFGPFFPVPNPFPSASLAAPVIRVFPNPTAAYASPCRQPACNTRAGFCLRPCEVHGAARPAAFRKPLRSFSTKACADLHTRRCICSATGRAASVDRRCCRKTPGVRPALVRLPSGSAETAAPIFPRTVDNFFGPSLRGRIRLQQRLRSRRFM